jgi:tetratricopeptide (TPR) repeat protein
VAGDREGVRRTLAQIGQVHAVRGTAEDGIRRLRAALEAVGMDEPTPGLAALYAALAHLYFAGGRIDEQLVAAERAMELARAVGDDRILADAETKRALALLLLGRLEDAQRVLEEAIPLAEAVGDLDILGRMLTNVGSVYGAIGELEQGRRYAERALEVAQQQGNAAQVVFATVTLGTWCFFVGDWAQARMHLERALGLGREIGAPRVVASPLVLLGWLCLAEGAWDEASRYLEEGCTIADRSAGFGLLLDAHARLAEREILEGHPDAACARLAPLLDAARQEVWGRPYAQAILAWAYLEMGDVAAAGELVGHAVRRARGERYGFALVEAQRVQAAVAIRQGRWEEAERALEEGLALARSMPYPYGEARLLHVYGQMHVAKGEPGPARERLEAALAIFRRLGARLDVERVERALATDAEGGVPHDCDGDEACDCAGTPCGGAAAPPRPDAGVEEQCPQGTMLAGRATCADCGRQAARRHRGTEQAAGRSAPRLAPQGPWFPLPARGVPAQSQVREHNRGVGILTVDRTGRG